MEAQPDFKEMFRLLNLYNVECIIVGSYALAFHGAPRNTGDIDIYVRPSPANASKMLEVLSDFGFRSLGLTANDFNQPGRIIQLGVPPVRIDLLTSISGVTWEEADKGKALGQYGDLPVYYLGKEQYRANKRATGRTRDLADLEAIGEE